MNKVMVAGVALIILIGAGAVGAVASVAASETLAVGGNGFVSFTLVLPFYACIASVLAPMVFHTCYPCPTSPEAA